VVAFVGLSARGEETGVSYYDRIKPIFSVRCHKCHGAELAKSGLRLDLSARAFAGGESGKMAIVKGRSGESELVRRITSEDADEQMPPKGARLTKAEIELIRKWIDQGAKWPARDDYWAFAAPRKPELPAVAKAEQGGNEIDRFLGAKLEAAGIVPAARADARTLLRRAYADLLGVPPAPEEAKAFLRDGSDDAYEKLVDRLLADPRYGERWGRHWLDLVRYGESDGYEDDKIRPHAWRYRDYVIRSFNSDKSYDRFVAEQIAGDELWPDDSDAWVATGFARLGSWDGMSKDPVRQRQDFLNDVTDATGAVFLGMTIGCARCHDHKYDRITQEDYYGLQAFFAGAKRETRELKGNLHDSPAVVDAYVKSEAKLREFKGQRDALYASAKKAIEDERAAKTELKGKKISDGEVMKKTEAMFPGKLGPINAKIKEIEYRNHLAGPVADVIVDGTGHAPKTVILKGGDLSRPGAEVTPRFVEAMMAEGKAIADIGASGRRATLARWLTSRENPLLARVMVNRIWQHLFGEGIVATPSDFGRNGKQPVNRELLDYLACRFSTEGYSIKKMQKFIMMSAAYRRADTASDAALAIDPENKLLWRMNRRRLEAEAIRDTILAVSGELSATRGGPGVYAKLPKNVSVELPNNDKELSWGVANDEENRRRSVYLFQRRSLTFPLMQVFDGPAMNQSCPVRAETTVASQALALFNGEFSREQAEKFAERLRREARADARARIERAFWIAFSRGPNAQEILESEAFLESQAKKRTGARAGEAAMVDFCHAMLNANELIYID